MKWYGRAQGVHPGAEVLESGAECRRSGHILGPDPAELRRESREVTFDSPDSFTFIPSITSDSSLFVYDEIRHIEMHEFDFICVG